MRWPAFKAFETRYVVCPACGTAAHRPRRWVANLTRESRRYFNNCAACGANLDGNRSKDFPRWQQWPAIGAFYLTNVFVWTAITVFTLAIPIFAFFDPPEHRAPMFAALGIGACWGFHRARRAHARGEMFERKKASRSEPRIE